MNAKPEITLANGARVLHFQLVNEDDNGLLKYGYVICEWGNEFVTWRACFMNGEWFAQSGHYYMNVVDAADDFKERVGWRDDERYKS